jgi:hypothetical protein
VGVQFRGLPVDPAPEFIIRKIAAQNSAFGRSAGERTDTSRILPYQRVSSYTHGYFSVESRSAVL